MQRWEIIERYVLLAVGTALLALDGWLLFLDTGPERFAWLVLLAPCTFWVFWQALYEDRLGTDQPVTRGERAMWRLWTWARRVVLGTAAAVLAAVGWHLAKAAVSLQGLGMAAALGLIACLAAWVAIYGAGRHKAASDDHRVHRERTKRYE